MTPCGGIQGRVTGSVAGLLDEWVARKRAFVMETNEAGMLLGGEVRGADAAVWRRDDLGAASPGYPRVPPLLVVEVAGEDEGETDLRGKAEWYLKHGVATIWIVLPATREVLCIRTDSESRHGPGERVAQSPELPELAPGVDRFFRQLQ